ncbi:glycine cleavage system protein GcvH [Methylocella silvestris]|uniref:Glycine cleavage system H protein n=1 Tax=Methylocella silvestris TaxID=199596 RepID=A0A2J7TFB8_METSI|nr:glycine cleavage system protein GcvH [Methylocella silvestris]PNG25449.1 glycine cleavage system protein H [Methylocella silvestris]
MSTMRFNQDHQWIRLDGDEAVVGITDYAQAQLGEVVHVDLPEVGARLERGQEVAAVESVKVSNGLDAPISGEVTAVNAGVTDDPTMVNVDPMGAGWFYKVRVADGKESKALMDEAAYMTFIDTLTT